MTKAKIKIPNIPSEKKNLISDKVATTRGREDETSLHFQISFKYYKNNLCEIENLSSSPARKCLTKLKQIGLSNHTTMKANNLSPRPVHNSKSYSSLFHSLTPDVKIFELNLGDSSRLFYFTERHTFHIISIKNKHIEI